MSRKDRIKACELAAIVMGGHQKDEAFAPKIWSLAVFFEQYIEVGATGTAKDFGPKKPRNLKVVE